MKFAAVFPGQGSQHPGMGKELFDNFKPAQLIFEEASDALHLDLRKLCFEGTDADLRLTQNTQPALLVTSLAAWQVFKSETDLQPQFGLGHSLGEYSALTASNAISLADGIRTVRVRGQAMQDAVPVGVGGMVAVLGLDDESVVELCAQVQALARNEHHIDNGVLEAANFNSPGQVVISGHQKILDLLKSAFKPEQYPGKRVKFIPLAVSAPFHCRLMEPAALKLKKHLETITYSAFAFPVIHNVTSRANSEPRQVLNLLFEQMTQPVKWHQSVREAKNQGSLATVEFGAGRVLTGLTKKIDPELKTFNVDTIENLKLTIQALKG